MAEIHYFQHAESSTVFTGTDTSVLLGNEPIEEISELRYRILKACGWSSDEERAIPEIPEGYSNTYLMVDLETLDQTASAIILACAMVNWHPFTDSIEKVQCSFPSRIQQEGVGQTCGEDTRRWWLSRGDALRAFCFDIPEYKRTELTEFTLLPVMLAFNDAEEIWCQGKDFDGRILQDLIRKVIPDYKFPYWKLRDSRDFEKKFGHLVDLRPLNQDKKDFGHNPIMDCKIQIAKMRLIHRALRELGAL